MQRSTDRMGPGYDKDATVRSNRSHRSNRSLHNVFPHDVRNSYKQPPPPSYHHAVAAQHVRQPLASRRDSSPSTVASLDSSSNRWDERNPRWSVWTADTTLNSSEADDLALSHHNGDGLHDGGITDDDLDKGELSSVPESTGGHSQMSSAIDYSDRTGDDEMVSDDVAGPSSYAARSFSSSSRPPSPTTEAALDAALSSTMLALTTANSLLLSTMSSRRELARLRALEAALDKDLTRKEADIKRQLDSNKKTIRWMERACQRLDDVINGRDVSDIENMSPEELAQLNLGPSSSINAAPGSAFLARHNRTASTAISDAREVPIPFGVVEAKDQTATIGKSAAKRLERMLQNSRDGTSKEDSSVVATSERPPSVIRPSRLRQSDSGRALRVRNSVVAAAAPVAATASTVDADVSFESVSTSNSPSKARPSKQSVRSDIDLSAMAGSVSALSEQNDGVASQMLSRLIAKPAGVPTSTQATADESAEGLLSAQFLTPPMNTTALPDDTDHLLSTPASTIASTSAATPSVLLRHRPSLSSTRSPSSLRVDNGPRSSVADQISGLAVRDGSRKGALEALRRLNGGSSNNEQGSLNGASSGPAAANAGGGGSWGGTLASWMGIGGGGAVKETDQSTEEE